MKQALLRCFAVICVLFLPWAYGAIDSYEFATAEQEQRFYELTNELRCPKCQNQSIADSNAPIAQDLRREVHRMVNEGADHQTVVDFMLARYGEFVLYKPQMSGKNLVLWLGPLVLLLIGFVVLMTIVRKAQNVSVVADDTLTPLQQKKLDNVLNSKEK